ncbi:hypothetical protein CPC08DRAFT_824160 [Agrocybe pediades]|nr:hypothetical protein CPC08DRAFT_824160 [Agrocybe pediades]
MGQYMLRLLRSISPPSHTVYTKAAEVCFDALELLPVPSSSWKHGAVADNTEDDPCPHLVFDNRYFAGPWTFRIDWSDLTDQNTIVVDSYGNKQLDSDDDEQSDSDTEEERLGKCESLGARYFTVLGPSNSELTIAADNFIDLKQPNFTVVAAEGSDTGPADGASTSRSMAQKRALTEGPSEASKNLTHCQDRKKTRLGW